MKFPIIATILLTTSFSVAATTTRTFDDYDCQKAMDAVSEQYGPTEERDSGTGYRVTKLVITHYYWTQGFSVGFEPGYSCKVTKFYHQPIFTD